MLLQENFSVAYALPLHIGVVLVAVLITAVTDIWKFKVHNLVTIPLLAAGFIYHGFVGGQAALYSSILGALFGFVMLIGLYLLGGMGAGDVKLMTEVGACLGLPLTFFVFLAASLAAGVYALIVTVMFHSLGETWTNLRMAWF